MTHPTTDALYEAIGPGITDDDPDRIWLAWLDGPGSLLGEVDDVVRDNDELPGWAAELTSDLTHRPRWTGQFLGVQVPEGMDDAAARALIRDRPAFRRGTVPALIAAAQTTLTGSRYVNVVERDGSAYRLRVQTFDDETPDPAATEAALRGQKPGSLLLTYQVIAPSSYAALEAEAAQTYTSLEAGAAQTYTDLEA